MRVIYLLLSLTVCCLSVKANEWPKQMGAPTTIFKQNNVQDELIKITVDTNYITRPTTNWIVKIRGRSYNDFVSVYGNLYQVGEFDSRINIPKESSIGISACYRGISLSLSVNPAKLLGKNSSRNINMSFYNNYYGADLSYSSTDNLTTDVTIGDKKWNKKLTDSYFQKFSASAYYVFNGRKFSYPASFTHSWIQRRSAGSFLVSANFYMGQFENRSDVSSYNLSLDKSISMKHITIGGGYAYNYLPNRKWLLHISLVPQVIVWHDYNYLLNIDPNTNIPLEKKITTNTPGLAGIGRFGATYSWENVFMGFNSVVQSSLLDSNNNEISAGDTQWNVEVFFGVRL